MPTPRPDAVERTSSIEPGPSGVPCPLPPTPPPDAEQPGASPEDSIPYRDGADDSGMRNDAEDDNTAGGMSIAQEHSLYQRHVEPALAPPSDVSRPQAPKEPETDKATMPHDYLVLRDDVPATPIKSPSLSETARSDVVPTLPDSESGEEDSTQQQQCCNVSCPHPEHNFADEDSSETSNTTPSQMPAQVESPATYPQGTQTTADTTSHTHPSSSTPRWDFSNVRLTPHYPSSLLRPGSHFTGTQQSDRQIYNVDVKILTLSVPQSTVTGYLRIQGLTDEHNILTTFFTGEIIGGPNQKYTFQTKHPSWGATDKTDLQHWARFPAWRPLSKDAKRDINFAYPPPSTGMGSESKAAAGQGWWQRENIFMRWKEWFLVPDHRVTSIQGASFEGFYYICFNQVEGRISGIYFHARSEK